MKRSCLKSNTIISFPVAVLLSACFLARSYGEERMSLFLHNRNGFYSRLSGDRDNQNQEDPEDSFGTRNTSFGPCVNPIGAGKCLSSTDAYYNFCRKDDVTLEDCQTSISKLAEAVGIDYDNDTSTCFALFPGVGLTKADLEVFCPKADDVAFYYPETSGFPVDGQSNVELFECFKCTRG